MFVFFFLNVINRSLWSTDQNDPLQNRWLWSDSV